MASLSIPIKLKVTFGVTICKNGMDVQMISDLKEADAPSIMYQLYAEALGLA